MNRKILITGGKGGVGKTTVTASIGRTLASMEYRTVVMDGDIGLNNLDVALHAEDKILYDVGDIATGKATINQALIRIEKDFYLLPSFTACSSLVSTETFESIASELSRSFNFVLVDCPAGIEGSFLRASHCAEESIVVTTPHLACIRDGYKTAKILSGLGYKSQYLLINRMKGNLVERNQSLSAEEIADAMKLPLIGVVPESPVLDQNGIVDPEKKNNVSLSYRLVAEFLTGKNKEVFDYRKDSKGLNAIIKRIKESV